MSFPGAHCPGAHGHTRPLMFLYRTPHKAYLYPILCTEFPLCCISGVIITQSPIHGRVSGITHLNTRIAQYGHLTEVFFFLPERSLIAPINDLLFFTSVFRHKVLNIVLCKSSSARIFSNLVKLAHAKIYIGTFGTPPSIPSSIVSIS